MLKDQTVRRVFLSAAFCFWAAGEARTSQVHYEEIDAVTLRDSAQFIVTAERLKDGTWRVKNVHDLSQWGEPRAVSEELKAAAPQAGQALRVLGHGESQRRDAEKAYESSGTMKSWSVRVYEPGLGLAPKAGETIVLFLVTTSGPEDAEFAADGGWMTPKEFEKISKPSR